MAQQDIFLSIVTAKAGLLKGESTDPAHTGEIGIDDWSWGMASPFESSGFAATGRVQIKPVSFTKRVDLSSTGLMSALRSNDTVKKAVLTMRKSGGVKPVNYFVITLENGRVLSYDVESRRDEHGVPALFEVVRLGFTRITIDYRAQDAKGAQLGAASYTDEISRPA